MALRSLLDVPAPAKLNLFLHVVGRRPDGYHRLQSLFVLIDWADTLHFERRDDAGLHRRDLGGGALPAEDLCLRAARLLQTESGTSFGVDIAIEKRVPSGAGMGGGSSDAATTLLALNRLWRLDWPRERLLELGLRLGADVPFFVFGRNAFVEGIGERLTPVRLQPRRYAVVKPPASIETRAIFASPLLGRSIETDIIESFTAVESDVDKLAAGSVDWPAVGQASNDLEAAAKAVCSQVGEASASLVRAFGNSRMTGSGSAVYADLGADLGADLPGLPPDGGGRRLELPTGWEGRFCRGLAEHPLVGWAAERSEAS